MKVNLNSMAGYLLNSKTLKTDDQEKEFLNLERQRNSKGINSEQGKRLLELKKNVLYYKINTYDKRHEDFVIMINKEFENEVIFLADGDLDIRKLEYYERKIVIEEIKSKILTTLDKLNSTKSNISSLKQEIKNTYKAFKDDKDPNLTTMIVSCTKQLKDKQSDLVYLESALRSLADDYKLVTSHFISV